MFKNAIPQELWRPKRGIKTQTDLFCTVYVKWNTQHTLNAELTIYLISINDGV